MSHTQKKYPAIYVLPLFVWLCFMSVGTSASSDMGEKRTLKTIIKFDKMIHLYKMNSKLEFDQEGNFTCGCQVSNLAHQPLCPNLCCKVDGLIFKVCTILPKCPVTQPLLTITLMEDGSTVQRNFSIFSPNQNTLFEDSLDGFFLPMVNMIYLSMEDFRTGTLAHEMTHYLISQFQPIPDRDIQEQWAQHVDTIVDPDSFVNPRY